MTIRLPSSSGSTGPRMSFTVTTLTPAWHAIGSGRRSGAARVVAGTGTRARVDHRVALPRRGAGARRGYEEIGALTGETAFAAETEWSRQWMAERFDQSRLSRNARASWPGAGSRARGWADRRREGLRGHGSASQPADAIAHAVRVEGLGYDGLHVAETVHDALAWRCSSPNTRSGSSSAPAWRSPSPAVPRARYAPGTSRSSAAGGSSWASAHRSARTSRTVTGAFGQDPIGRLGD